MKALADIQPEDDELLALKNEFDQKMGELDEDKLLEAGGAFGDDEDDEDDGGGKKPSGGAGGGGSMGQMFNREYWKVRGELSADIENQYVERECRKAREQKEREQANLKKIRAAWNGVGMEACFKAWKKDTRKTANMRIRDEARGVRMAFEARQAPKAVIKMARWNVIQWGDPQLDVWSDRPYWEHTETKEIRWTLPVTAEFIPQNFKWPPEYEGLTDEELDSLVVRHAAFEDVDVPYPDADFDSGDEGEGSGSDSSSGSDSDSDSDSDDDDDEDDEDDEDDDDTTEITTVDDTSASSSSSSSSSTSSSLSSARSSMSSSSSMGSSGALVVRKGGGTDMALPMPKKPSTYFPHVFSCPCELLLISFNMTFCSAAPSNHQTIKPSNHQTIKPSNHQTIKPSGPGGRRGALR